MDLLTCCISCDQSNGVEVTSVGSTTGGDEYYHPPEDSVREQGSQSKTATTTSRDADVAPPDSPTMSRQTSQASRSSRSRPLLREFEAQVIRGSGSLGLDIMTSKDHTAIIISRIKVGAVQTLNDGITHNASVGLGDTDGIIKRGDRIVEVDGCGLGDVGEITRALKSASEIVTLKISRLLEFKLGNLPEGAGLKFAEGPTSSEMIIAGLEPTANKSLQPDLELRIGDVVVKVNGKSGTPAEMQAEIDASGVLNLRIRRAEQ